MGRFETPSFRGGAIGSRKARPNGGERGMMRALIARPLRPGRGIFFVHQH
jgi:hypothetical protein